MEPHLYGNWDYEYSGPDEDPRPYRRSTRTRNHTLNLQRMEGEELMERNAKMDRNTRIMQMEHAIQRAQAEIDRVLRLPAEPTTDDDQPLVVFFQHRFNQNSRTYDYAAIKAGDGLWYTTGPASPKGYTWDQLMDWHMSEVNENATVYRAKKFKAI